MGENKAYIKPCIKQVIKEKRNPPLQYCFLLCRLQNCQMRLVRC